ncbi:hypothetical protein L493_0767 [Bordetella bronchiseptica 99-R-0433]|nr:hypothetical protein L493_0767 [Bordetella bronchiseptica 99-R-0433]
MEVRPCHAHGPLICRSPRAGGEYSERRGASGRNILQKATKCSKTAEDAAKARSIS